MVRKHMAVCGAFCVGLACGVALFLPWETEAQREEARRASYRVRMNDPMMYFIGDALVKYLDGHDGYLPDIKSEFDLPGFLAQYNHEEFGDARFPPHKKSADLCEIYRYNTQVSGKRLSDLPPGTAIVLEPLVSLRAKRRPCELKVWAILVSNDRKNLEQVPGKWDNDRFLSSQEEDQRLLMDMNVERDRGKEMQSPPPPSSSR